VPAGIRRRDKPDCDSGIRFTQTGATAQTRLVAFPKPRLLLLRYFARSLVLRRRSNTHRSGAHGHAVAFSDRIHDELKSQKNTTDFSAGEGGSRTVCDVNE